MTVCLNGRLDSHYYAQLQTLYREAMWSNLHDAFISMDEYANYVEITSQTSLQTMETIYK